MEVILCKDVENVGRVGDVIKVKEGFGRNYLIPRKMAMMATAGNLKRIDQQKAKEAKLYEEQKKQAGALAEKLSKVSCTVPVEVNDYEKLYGSVTDVDIARAIEQEGFKIDRKSIILDKPIEELGIFEIAIQLHPEVTAKIRLWVTKK